MCPIEETYNYWVGEYREAINTKQPKERIEYLYSRVEEYLKEMKFINSLK